MADFKLKINVVLDLKELLLVDRYSKKNQPELLNQAGNRYLQFLRNSYIAKSSGRGAWSPLSEKTIERKEQRGIADSPHWILREYDHLLYSLDIKQKGKELFVGYVRDRTHLSGRITIHKLVKIHSLGAKKGKWKLPARPIIVLPNNSLRKKMVEDVKKVYQKVIRANRRKK